MIGVRRVECDGLQHLASLRSADLHPRRTQSKSRTLGIAIAMRGSVCRTMVCVSRSLQTRTRSVCIRHLHSHEHNPRLSLPSASPRARNARQPPRAPAGCPSNTFLSAYAHTATTRSSSSSKQSAHGPCTPSNTSTSRHTSAPCTRPNGVRAPPRYALSSSGYRRSRRVISGLVARRMQMILTSGAGRR